MWTLSCVGPDFSSEAAARTFLPVVQVHHLVYNTFDSAASVKWRYNVLSICIFLDTNELEHFCVSLLSFWNFPSTDFLFTVFDNFPLKFLSSYPYVFYDSLFLDISSYLILDSTNISLPKLSYGYKQTQSIVSEYYKQQKFSCLRTSYYVHNYEKKRCLNSPPCTLAVFSFIEQRSFLLSKFSWYLL